ncbi:MAG: hypothetical protein HQK92_14575 [Nitrospirae bacterium]|nr:hypothetical protein [Nitrospirota bacterium]
MKKVITIVMVFAMLLSTAALFAGDKVVGTVKAIDKKGEGVMDITVTDEKSKKDVVINCNKDCDVKAGADAVGAKVTVETKAKGKVVRKAVAGC